jgi:hypothetical protein
MTWWHEFVNALAGRTGEVPHRHQWVETSRRFNLPPGKIEQTGFVTHEQVMELAYGVTVVALRCSGCGDVKAVRYAGNAEARR